LKNYNEKKIVKGSGAELQVFEAVILVLLTIKAMTDNDKDHYENIMELPFHTKHKHY